MPDIKYTGDASSVQQAAQQVVAANKEAKASVDQIGGAHTAATPAVEKAAEATTKHSQALFHQQSVARQLVMSVRELGSAMGTHLGVVAHAMHGWILAVVGAVVLLIEKWREWRKEQEELAEALKAGERFVETLGRNLVALRKVKDESAEYARKLEETKLDLQTLTQAMERELEMNHLLEHAANETADARARIHQIEIEGIEDEMEKKAAQYMEERNQEDEKKRRAVETLETEWKIQQAALDAAEARPESDVSFYEKLTPKLEMAVGAAKEEANRPDLTKQQAEARKKYQASMEVAEKMRKEPPQLVPTHVVGKTEDAFKELQKTIDEGRAMAKKWGNLSAESFFASFKPLKSGSYTLEDSARVAAAHAAEEYVKLTQATTQLTQLASVVTKAENDVKKNAEALKRSQEENEKNAEEVNKLTEAQRKTREKLEAAQGEYQQGIKAHEEERVAKLELAFKQQEKKLQAEAAKAYDKEGLDSEANQALDKLYKQMAVFHTQMGRPKSIPRARPSTGWEEKPLDQAWRNFYNATDRGDVESMNLWQQQIDRLTQQFPQKLTTLLDTMLNSIEAAQKRLAVIQGQNGTVA